MLDGLREVVVLPAIRERIGRHVQHADHKRALAKIESLPIREIDLKFGSHLT
jgi:hypothetical protein